MHNPRSGLTPKYELLGMRVDASVPGDGHGDVMRTIRATLDTYLGRCPRCMRQSLLAALAMWVFAAALGASLGANFMAWAAGGAALAATLLWASHLLAYALRSARAPQDDAALASRRRFATNLLRAAGVMAAVTALPNLARAQDRLHACLSCCDKNLSGCGNGGDCNVNYQNCVNNCNAQGELPVTWRCW